MKFKIGDAVKIDMKKLKAIKNSPAESYYLATVAKKLLESRNDTLYVSGTSNEKQTINVRSWKNDYTGDLTLPISVVKSMLVEGKETVLTQKMKLDEFIKKESPTNLKPGDYVELDGKAVMGMIDGGDILRAMKKSMNVMYIHKITNGTMLVSPFKFIKNVADRHEVPVSFAKFKLLNVQED